MALKSMFPEVSLSSLKGVFCQSVSSVYATHEACAVAFLFMWRVLSCLERCFPNILFQTRVHSLDVLPNELSDFKELYFCWVKSVTEWCCDLFITEKINSFILSYHIELLAVEHIFHQIILLVAKVCSIFTHVWLLLDFVSLTLAIISPTIRQNWPRCNLKTPQVIQYVCSAVEFWPYLFWFL